ncbi:MAG: hypothetical protein HYT98_02800 [Candidatus Sungbacteria bacterium]|nr:hypothetical protein [Candidatus Sungbacteria bacterium]
MDTNKFNRPWDYWLLWAVLLFSLALNVYLFVFINGLRKAARGPLSNLAQVIKDIQNQTITTRINIQEEIPFSMQVPIKDTFKIPIKVSVPILTIVNVPVTIPILGQEITLRVPIDTAVPVDTVVTVPLNSAIPIKGTAPVSFEIPVSLEIKQTPFGPFFEKLYDWILAAKQKL